MTKLHVDSSHDYIILWMSVRNIGVSFAAAAASTASMEEIPPALSGHASSVTNWVRNVGGSFAIALFTALLISGAAKHAAELAAEGGKPKAVALQAYTSSVNDVFLIATAIAALALPLGLIVGKRKKARAAVAIRRSEKTA
jgi:urea transporter